MMPDTKPMRERIAEAMGRYMDHDEGWGHFSVVDTMNNCAVVREFRYEPAARAECARLNVDAVLEELRNLTPEMIAAVLPIVGAAKVSPRDRGLAFQANVLLAPHAAPDVMERGVECALDMIRDWHALIEAIKEGK